MIDGSRDVSALNVRCCWGEEEKLEKLFSSREIFTIEFVSAVHSCFNGKCLKVVDVFSRRCYDLRPLMNILRDIGLVCQAFNGCGWRHFSHPIIKNAISHHLSVYILTMKIHISLQITSPHPHQHRASPKKWKLCGVNGFIMRNLC